MLLFMLESILTLGAIALISYIIGSFMAWTVEGSWVKRYFFGYPIQLIFWNLYAALAWILTIIGDWLFSFIRFGYTLISKGPRHDDDIHMYLNTEQSRENAFIFWVIVCNLIALYIIYITEKNYKREKNQTQKKLEEQKLANEESEKLKEPKPSYITADIKLQDKMNADLDRFNKKFNIK